MPTDLYLIRHGESVANVEPAIGGMRGDAGLTDRGRRQAERLAARLSTWGPRADHLYASTLPRARETAGYVASALGLEVSYDDELQELRPGEADGLSVAEWLRRFPAWQNGPFANPYAPFAPGGESWAGFLARAGAALDRLVTEHAGRTVVAVSHGGVVEASFYLAFGLGGSSTAVAFTPVNTGITHWRHDPSVNGRPTWTLVSYNDARHLNDPADAASPQAVPTPAEGE